jgi:UDP-N-acetylmuramoyl-L-alanyl-D-glutamate--2,6-diaminopimelate ligase
MGQAVERYADRIYVTSDNPRSEDPERIIDDIVGGMQKSFIREWDRTKAITMAVKNMSRQTVVLIAGKGHEDYQEIAGVKHPYSDYAVIRELLER